MSCKGDFESKVDQPFLALGRPLSGTVTLTSLLTREEQVRDWKCSNVLCAKHEIYGICNRKRKLIFPNECKHLIVSIEIFLDAFNTRTTANITGFSPSRPFTLGDDNNTHWIVSAVVYHTGITPNSGHYTCTVIQDNTISYVSDEASTPRLRLGATKDVRMVLLSRVE